MTTATMERFDHAVGAAQAAVHGVKHSLNLRLAKRMRQVGLENHASKLEKCQCESMLWFCHACGAHEYRIQSCKYRHCNFCSVPRLLEIQKRISAIIESVHRPKLLTLTMPPQQDLKIGIDLIKKAFSNWRRMQPIDKIVRGGCYTIEVVPKGAGWHVHIHAIIQAEYLPVQKIWETWRKALGIPHANADIRELKGQSGIKEAIKYITKGTHLIKMTNPQLYEYITHLTKRRMFGTFGEWFNPDWDKLMEPEEYESPPCPHCLRTETMRPVFMGPMIFKQFWEEFVRYNLRDLPETKLPTWITTNEKTNLPVFDPVEYNRSQWLQVSRNSDVGHRRG